MKRYFIFAGEASGDLHGSRLIHAFFQIDKHSFFEGVGGPRMRQKSFNCFIEMEEFQVMGFTDVFKALPRLIKHFFKIRKHILTENPDGVILIDYPGFNLRLARSLRKGGYQGKIIQYVCPSVWAHGRDRIETLTHNYDLLLTIYPFEPAYFEQTLLPVKYVGNPLIDTIGSHGYNEEWKTVLNIPSTNKLISLFPGSRKGEIKRHLPQQLQAAIELKKKYPDLIFALSCGQETLKSELNSFIVSTPLQLNRDLFIIPPHFTYDLMRSSHLALAKSGTVTLELALHGIPTVVHYQPSPLNYLIAKHFLRLNLPYYCIVNLLGNNTIFPELINKNILPSDLCHQMELLLCNQDRQNEVKSACQVIKRKLGNHAAHLQSAHAIKELFE